MIRAIARQAEAERERRAKIINAEGEQQAAQKLVEAARIAARSNLNGALSKACKAHGLDDEQHKALLDLVHQHLSGEGQEAGKGKGAVDLDKGRGALDDDDEDADFAAKVREYLKGKGLADDDVERAIELARKDRAEATDRLPVPGPEGRGGYRSGRSKDAELADLEKDYPGISNIPDVDNLGTLDPNRDRPGYNPSVYRASQRAMSKVAGGGTGRRLATPPGAGDAALASDASLEADYPGISDIKTSMFGYEEPMATVTAIRKVDEADPRGALRLAIEHEVARAADLAKRQTSLEAATKHVAAAEERLRTASAAVGKAREEHAGRVVRAVVDGRAPPMMTLQDKRDSENEARDELEAAKAATTQIEEQIADLEIEVATTENQVLVEVNVVLAHILSQKFEAAKRLQIELFVLKGELRALIDKDDEGVPRFADFIADHNAARQRDEALPMRDAVRHFLSVDHPNFADEVRAKASAAQRSWTEARRLLREDPEAELSPSPFRVG
jgi:hypothetical protein